MSNMPTLSELLSHLPAAQCPAGAETIPINRVVCDSRRASAGDLFVAIQGSQFDGHKAIAELDSRGVAAFVTQRPVGLTNRPVFVVPDTRAAFGVLAHAAAGFPARDMTLIGVTGTNGKSTVTSMIRAILQNAGLATAAVGTIGRQWGGQLRPATHTTPDAALLCQELSEMRDDGIDHVVMEVSSHALSQYRVSGLSFDVAIFTNLSGDHQDYHSDMDEYFSAKAMLFESLSEDAKAIVNLDDPRGAAIGNFSTAPVWYFSRTTAADFQADNIHCTRNGTVFDMKVKNGSSIPVQMHLIGKHNVSNALAAAAACFAVNLSAGDIAAGLTRLTSVPGRLQVVSGTWPFAVVVDYAHTDDALANVLAALRPLTENHLWVVFGCGGDRDRAKRPRMAAVAAQMADCLVLTQDNPRTEDPQQILNDILSGLSNAQRNGCIVESDRGHAIARAICQAETGDIVLIAGKGHEDYQILGTSKIHFDDAEVAQKHLCQRFGA